MSFTDQKPRIATEQDIKAQWSGQPNGKYFRCTLCGHKFQVGDYYRFVFSKLGNIMTCKICDDNPEEKWAQIHDEWDKLKEGKFWKFIYQLEDGLKDTEREFSRESRESIDEIKYWKNEALYGTDERRRH